MNYPVPLVVFDRKHQATKKKEGLVQIEIWYGRKKKTISTGVKVFQGQWKNATMVTGRTDAFELNERILLLLTNIREFINSLMKEKKPFSIELLNEFLRAKEEPEENCTSFLDFVEKRIEERQIKASTKRQHRVMLRRLREFGKIRMFEDLTLKNIKLLDDFQRKFTSVQTTIYGFHKRVKIYVKEAYEYDLIEKNPYEKFKVARGDYKIRYPLTPENEKKIIQCEIDDDSMNKVRDLFMFCRYTGLAYADVVKFNYKRDVIKEKGVCMIYDVRQKTGTPYRLSLLSPAVKILEKYDYILPIMSLTQFNMRLKVLACYAKINQKLSSHIARHTFATWALSQGISIETLGKMLGHKDIRTTQIYAKVLQMDVSKGYMKLQKKLSVDVVNSPRSVG